jgi:rhamnogalacturonan endolyase
MPERAIQDETAILAGGTTFYNDRSGYHGNGFIDFPSSGGSARLNNIEGGDGGAENARGLLCQW